jgi:hypothetical protein
VTTGPAVGVSLYAGGIAVEVDRVGAELRSLRSPAGVEILFQTPWPVEESDRTTDDNAWVRGWRGGWSVLVPNAGPACTVDGVSHPYHGDATTLLWDVDDVSDSSVSLSVLVCATVLVRRTVSVDRMGLEVETRITNISDRPAPFLRVEHLILGPPLVGARTVVELPEGGRQLLDPAGDPGRWERSPGRGASRFGSIAAVSPQRARVLSGDGSLGLELEWAGADLRHLWYWWENGGERDDPWSSRTTCLGLEPSSAPSAAGLLDAVESGQACWLVAGETRGAAVRVVVTEQEAG